MKLLYLLNTTDRVNSFSRAAMMAAQNTGIEFHIAGNWRYPSEAARLQDEKDLSIRIHQVPIRRSPFHPGNVTAYRQILKILQKEHIDAIYCNTPVGGLLGRLAGARKHIRPVLYEAHGFHFYKGAPVQNWLLYYPVERLLARLTDGLITINEEDRLRAATFPLRSGKTYTLPGVGIDLQAFPPKDLQVAAQARKELGLPEDACVLLSAGELNRNKHHKVILSALAKSARCDLHYILCGTGPQENALRQQAKALGLDRRVHFLGYRTDLTRWLAAADVFVLSSLREGLPRSVLEAMACGLPCVVSDIRGNRDLIDDGKGGYLCNPHDETEFAHAITTLAADPARRTAMGQYNRRRAADYDLSAVVAQTEQIYRELFPSHRE